MPDVELVEFVIRLSGLRKATKHLMFNRAGFGDTDSADLLVSQCIATFRAPGTEFEAPVQGTRSGTVRLPVRQLRDLMSIADSYKRREVPLHFEPGMFRVGTCVRRHPDISLGIFPDRRIDLPPDWIPGHASYRPISFPRGDCESRPSRTSGNSSKTGFEGCLDSV